MQRSVPAIVFLLVGVGGVVSARFITEANYPWIGFLAVVLGALPSFIFYVRQVGLKRGIVMLFVLGLFALLFESMAVYTGFPYGHFSYSDMLGPKFTGLVPWSVPFAWVPLVLMSGSIASRFTKQTVGIVALGTAILLMADLVIDPIAAALGFWKWENTGVYYGIPFLNFVGWGMSGAIGIGIWKYFSGTKMQYADPLWLSCSALLSISFFSGISIAMGMIIPFVLGLILVGVVYSLGLSSHRYCC